ncbi:hypothetical protein BH10PSE7_BH10PSE7_02630 [soil metagenome]
MVDLTYIGLVLSMCVIGVFLGIAGHFLRANATPYPEKLFDSDLYNEAFMDGYFFEKYAIGAEWDDSGYWDGNSLRNLAYYIISGFMVPALVGLYFWDQRAAIVPVACHWMQSAHLHPPLC